MPHGALYSLVALCSHEFVPGFRGEARGLGESSFFPFNFCSCLLCYSSADIQATPGRDVAIYLIYNSSDEPKDARPAHRSE